MADILFNHILIIGGGLIGSSIARAVRVRKPAAHLTLADNGEGLVRRIQALDIADTVVADAKDSARDVDLVILAVPPGRIVEVGQSIAENLKPGTIVTDVGSIKSEIVEDLTPVMPGGVTFIGGHPITGTEYSGPEAGFATLFEKRWCILTPKDESGEAAQKLKSFWLALRSEVAFMDAKRHDIVLATTSHLPHLIAYALVGTATDMETVTRNEVVKYSAGGFRDFTRIAASDPVMWRDVFLGNKDSVLEMLDRFIEDLTALKRAVRWGEGDSLLRQFTKTRDIRRSIIDAGQDRAEPNFGRDQLEHRVDR